MAHHHEHHSHEHHHHRLTDINRSFVIGIILNAGFVLIEVFAGFWTNSLALLTDAGHNLSDVAGLALSLLGFRLARHRSNSTFTYGYRKITILIALLNALILILALGGIVWEAIARFNRPYDVEGETIAVVAFIGIIINGLSAFFFMRENELNARSAYLHLLADALVSLAVVVGGILIYYTGWQKLDSLISIGIASLVLISTWRLLGDSLRLALDGVPQGVDLEQIRQKILTLPQVENFTHIHIWAISTTENALTGHLVIHSVTDIQEIEKIRHNIKHQLEHLNIQHSTIEITCRAIKPEDITC